MYTKLREAASLHTGQARSRASREFVHLGSGQMSQPRDYGGSYGNPGPAYGQDRIWKGEQYDPQAHLQRIGSPQLLSPGLGEPGYGPEPGYRAREAHPSNPQPWVPSGAEHYPYRQSAPQAQYAQQYLQPTQYAAPPQYA